MLRQHDRNRRSFRVLAAGALSSVALWSPTAAITMPSTGCGGCEPSEHPAELTPARACISIHGEFNPCADPKLIVANMCQGDVVLDDNGLESELREALTIPPGVTSSISVPVDVETGSIMTTFYLSYDSMELVAVVDWRAS